MHFDIQIDTPHRAAQPCSLSTYRKAREFALKAGMPESVNFADKEVLWQISPSDSALSARIQIIGTRVLAILTMSYMGRVVQMIRIVFDGARETSEGLLYRNDPEKAFRVFRSHIKSMLHGPVLIPAVAALQQTEHLAA